MTFPSEAEHATAIKAALTAANARPYDFGVIVGSEVSAYNLVSVTDRFGGVPRLTGQFGTRGVRVEIRSLGKANPQIPENPMANAREMRRRADLALRGVVLTIAGRKTTPIQFESADPIDQDGDQVTTGAWFSGPMFYTYAI